MALLAIASCIRTSAGEGGGGPGEELVSNFHDLVRCMHLGRILTSEHCGDLLREWLDGEVGLRNVEASVVLSSRNFWRSDDVAQVAGDWCGVD